MVWATPLYERSAVNEAGRGLLNGIPEPPDDEHELDDYYLRLDAYYESLEVVNNWRSSHSYPINTFQATLRKRAQK